MWSSVGEMLQFGEQLTWVKVLQLVHADDWQIVCCKCICHV